MRFYKSVIGLMVVVVTLSVSMSEVKAGETENPAVEALIKALGDKHPNVVQEAAKGLIEIGDPAAVEPLIDALAYQSLYIRASRRASEKLQRKWHERYKTTALYISRALAEIGEPALEPLIKALKNKNPYVRRYAAKALGQIGDPRGVKPLIKLFGDECHDVQDYAAQALGKIGKPALEALTGLIEDERWDLRIYVAQALGRVGGPKAVKLLIKLLGDEYSLVRESAAEALEKIGSPPAKPLIKAVEDESSCVRENAAKALGKVGKPAVKCLIGALEDEASGVRMAAAESLHLIGWKPKSRDKKILYYLARCNSDMLVEIGRPAVEPLIKSVEDENWRIRRCAVSTLAEIATREK